MQQKVYLAGGFRTEWQDKVREALGGNLLIYDPKTKEYKNGERVTMDLTEYGTWDLHHIKLTDIMFVYLERTNPSCIGAVIEAGYAKGLNKTVITVLEKGHLTIEDRYLDFIKKVSDVVYDNLEDGIAFLKSF